ncbi:DUF3110 domain-containing protein [Synechococcus sp. Nb3U1]|uniref:DUF3110 domain-containing protein n=1 Tax=Synechococcus sp. Nb3U1 TaxID=1914529 RepID=UPI001F244935|nr:DUF3110 domain-containing protein [Synechococcus sp. Nb3U1]MCF2971139.1 DUF3110 domain-containing protein [Synechococcus sp. Nb3U1]
MNTAEALEMLNLPAGASEREIRGRLFQEYQTLSTALTELEDERQRLLFEVQLARLNEARDVLLRAAQPRGSQPENVLSLVSPEDLPAQVIVLLYQTNGQEGICTRQVGGQDIVLAFESSFGARKYAQRLAQQGLSKPVPERFDTEEIVDFCRGGGYGLMVVPANEALEPLEESTESAQDWQGRP